MIDLETYGKRPGCVVLSVGAIKFDRAPQISPLEQMETFYQRVNLDSCRRLGLFEDRLTVEWWQHQPTEAYYEAVENPDRAPVEKVLTDLSEWFNGSRYIWCNGLTFDVPILNEVYYRCKLPIPWQYWDTRDTRTIWDVAGIRKSDMPDQNKHHPVYDCYRQIVGVKKAFGRLKS